MSQLYREAGTCGHAKSTVTGKHSALNHFVAFLSQTKILSTRPVDKMNCAMKAISDNSPQNSLSMLCRQTPAMLKAYFKDDNLYRSSETWNTEVRGDVNKIITYRCIWTYSKSIE